MSPSIPENLHLDAFALIPAELPGSARFWALYAVLDRGAVSHIAYCGMLLADDAETAAQLNDRARARLAELCSSPTGDG